MKGQPQAALLAMVFATRKFRTASPAPVALQDGNPEVSSQASSLFHVAVALIWELFSAVLSVLFSVNTLLITEPPTFSKFLSVGILGQIMP